VGTSLWLIISSRVSPCHVVARGANRRRPRPQPSRPSGSRPTPPSSFIRGNHSSFFLFSHSPPPSAQCFRSQRLRRCVSPPELRRPANLRYCFAGRRQTSSRKELLQRLCPRRDIGASSSFFSPRRRRTTSPAFGSSLLRRTSSSSTPPPQVRPNLDSLLFCLLSRSRLGSVFTSSFSCFFTLS
jgi:hypothetical protein